MNTHKDCEFYVKENDMCLLYFEFEFHNVSQYHECLENVVFNDSNKNHVIRMENKQFKLSKICLNNPNAICDNGEPLTQKEVVVLLNEQKGQIKKLKQENKMLKNNINKLTGDIKYLKTLPSQHRELYKQTEIKRINLSTENNLLKEQIQELEKEIKRLNCINKQLEDRLGGDVALDMDCGDV